MNLNNDILEDLGKRLRAFSEQNDSYAKHVDYRITENNLLLNLDRVIARALLIFPEAKSISIDDFNKLLDLQKDLSREFTAEYFLKRGFIREIFSKIEIPHTVLRTLKDVSENKIEVPDEYASITSVLLQFSKLFQSDDKEISDKEIKKSLSNSEIELLVDHEILQPNGNAYRWKNSDHGRYLRNEITSLLWLHLLEDHAIDSDEKRVIRLVQILTRFQIHWPEKLNTLIEPKKLQRLKKASFNVIVTESDILNKGFEFQKSWLDSPRYSERTMFDEIPDIEISSASPQGIISQFSEIDNTYHLEMGFEETRSIYGVFLRFVACYDGLGPLPDHYKLVKQLLLKLDHPYIVYGVYWDIKTHYPEISAFLVQDSLLMPVASRIVKEIEIRGIDKQIDLPTESRVDRVSQHRESIRHDLWIDALDLFLRSNFDLIPKIGDSSKALFDVLMQGIEDFYQIGNHRDYSIEFAIARGRIEAGFIKLKDIRLLSTGWQLRSRSFFYVIPYLFEELNKRHVIIHTNHRFLDLCGLEMASQLIRLISIQPFQDEIPKKVESQLEKVRKKLANYLLEKIEFFFTSDSIDVVNRWSQKSESQKPKFVYPQSFDITDWGLVMVYINKYGLLDYLLSSFEKRINFNREDGIYDELNHDTYRGLRLFIKALAYSIIQIQAEKSRLSVWNLNPEQTLDLLYEEAEKYALKYCVDDLKRDRINVFKDPLYLDQGIRYYQDFTTVVFKSFDFRSDEKNIPFIEKFVSENKDLGGLLNISNSVKSYDLRRILTEKIKSMSLEEFISESRNWNDWRNAMIDAVNSLYHFELSLPLAERLEEFNQKRQIKNPDMDQLLFEVRMLHAFRKKDIQGIKDAKAPGRNNRTLNNQVSDESKREFFLGLHYLYNSKEYEAAKSIFEKLTSQYPQNVDYRFRLFHAQTLLGVQQSKGVKINQSYQDWKDFKEKTTEIPSSLKHVISMTELHYLINQKDNAEVDKILESLPIEAKFDEDICQAIFNMYVARDLVHLANEYIMKGYKFYQSISTDSIPRVFGDLYASLDFSSDLDRLRKAYSEIYSLPPKSIIHTIPPTINDKRNLDEFILLELIKAGKILMEKIRAIENIPHENKYNDVFQSILRSRIPLWGWNIPDQHRTGDSYSSGDDLGSSDFTVESTGETMALIEALVLKGKDKKKVTDHILKCKDYLTHTTLFYIITYYKGSDSNFPKTWASYKRDVEGIDYPIRFKLANKKLSNISIESARNILVGKTAHEDDISIYHLFFNLGEGKSQN